MTADVPGADLARRLAGVGGAPGRPGHVYVVVLPDEVGALSARAAVLLASADLVLTEGDVDHPVLKVAAQAEVQHRAIGAPVDPGDYVVVRVVGAERMQDMSGLVDELSTLDRAGIPFEVEPPPTHARGVPTVLTAWRDRLPLRGRRILVPRTREQASGLSMHIHSLGGEPIEAPTIAVEPGDLDHLREAVEDVAEGAFRAVCLTSPNGADALADAILAAGHDGRILDRVRRVACVGPGTATRLFERLHVRADLVPETATSEGLVEAFPAGSGHVLLPRADIATATLRDGLVSLGYQTVDVVAYRTVSPPGLASKVVDDLAAGRIDMLAFASSSTVRNFVDLMGERPWRGAVVSIGPVTSQTARDLGLTVAAEGDPHTVEGLVDALCAAARRLG